jgi:hypothetical protein
MVFPTNKRIEEFTNMLGSSGSPTDLKAVSSEVEVTGKGYPQKLNIMCASIYAGEAGEGGFELQIISTDPKTTAVML